MNKIAIRRLYQALPELVASGILTQETADRIRKHYGEVKSFSKKIVTLIVLGTVGALLIGMGVILLFGHNWEQLSRFTRAILSMTPLVAGQGLALWVLLKRPQSSPLKESVATFLSLMVGASIALISQTYNIPGDAGTFMLTWMLLIAPVVYFMQASLPAAIYLIGITAWCGSSWNDPAKAILFWPMAAVVIPHFVWTLRQEIYTFRTTLLSLTMVICVSFAASFSLGKTWVGSWVIIFPSIYSICYLLGTMDVRTITANWQRPLRLIGGIGLFVLAFQFTFKYAWQYFNGYSYGITRKITFLNALPDNVISIVIVAAAMLLLYDNIKRKNLIASLFGMVPLLSITAYLVNGQSAILPLIIFNIYLFVLSTTCIISGIRDNNLAVVNAGMLMLAILIVARFFDSDIGFITKGLVFIAIGTGFLFTNMLLVRRMGGAK
ncbi:MAG: DUF2157 domain-containing protein [Candidatus Omnitrophica bacterium]|nr:DUF2157 domain-containing protein [Candidatus Omnitrophota bacterium]